MQSPRLENLASGCTRKCSNRGDPATANADVGVANSARAGDRAAADEKVEHLSGHLSWCYGRWIRGD
jgi:hypothetical protein